jgi:signal transduction histidine kinase
MDRAQAVTNHIYIFSRRSREDCGMLSTDQKPDESGLSPLSLSFLGLRDMVLAEWEREVRARVKGARDLLSPVLLNTLPAFYGNIAQSLTPSYPRDDATGHTSVASAHGGERARLTSFGVDQVIQEYQIFREAIRVAARGKVQLGEPQWIVIDHSINSAVVEAVRGLMRSHEELRKRVAASLSHDMRAPLSVIANGASLVAISKDLEVAHRSAARIGSNAQRMSQMISELLDALTDHSGPEVVLALSEFDIRALVETTCEEFNAGGAGRFEAAGDSVKGHWCKITLRRALDNLATNAVKYGDGGIVIIKSDKSRDRMMLTVRNTGNPIPKERHELIFEYLQRGAHPADETGWGIGLPYVKKVAEAHGGSVAVDSSPESGTTFFVDLPIDSRPFVARLAPSPDQGASPTCDPGV